MSLCWNQYFFNLIEEIRKKSKDKNTQFGCIIVGPDNEIRATGYNSFPRGLNDDLPERQIRPEKYIWMVHAERNAFYNAARVGVPLKGCILYIDGIPCTDCAQGVVQVGISKVIYNDDRWQVYLDKQQKIAEEQISKGKQPDKTWLHGIQNSIQMFKECGVELVSFKKG
jgi:dCMP deaminase